MPFRRLINAGAGVKATDKIGRLSTRMREVRAGSEYTVWFLVDADADINATGKDRRMALHDAAQARFSHR